ncbi:GMC oxidoreductase [Membranihabitans maritimus]|uniref:GMC oxidoreductase n=1 Tax=Membranihabitans maritimus TaxID=2904244 RepID=UPI001F21EEB3|nr:GMC family oxidoreductase [Membranihabitans maritimus]
MYFNSQNNQNNTYDAIVVGSGISGGWAAKELSEKGLKTLVLERGRMVKHGDYPTANMDPWDAKHRGKVLQEEIEEHYPKQSRTGYTISQYTKHWFVKDSEHPYLEDKRFDWMRGYHVGGRSLMWGRQCYRWSDLDFEANLKEGIGIDWPIRYKDIAPWYDYVENYVGIAGKKEGLAHLPDGPFLKPMELNVAEQYVIDRIREVYDDRILTNARVANLSEAKDRGACQYRNRCIRGCPFGGYFSSVSATLPDAERSGNMSIRPYSIVHSVIYDPKTGKASGVRVIDAETKEEIVFNAKVIFLTASCLGSTQILMNSKSSTFSEGLGNTNGVLGRNLMDHHFLISARGKVEGLEDYYYKGRRPGGTYMPRFRNIDSQSKMKDFVRGYGLQGGGGRGAEWQQSIGELKYGKDGKEQLFKPGGPWTYGMIAFGECLPYEDNIVYQDSNEKDQWGIPLLRFDAEWKENELNMRKDMKVQVVEMLEKSGLKDVQLNDRMSYPGLGIHEMGTARMGRDPKTSILNQWNQIHNVKNVFVTDGACMTSSGCQNPSITYMALTARACDHAVKELNRQNL